MTIDDMRVHIDRLIAELRVTKFPFEDDLHIHWIDDREQAFATTDIDPVEIHLPKIQSPLDYATCLHELGHICGRYQKSRYVLTRERWAWDWARKHALQWTRVMEQDAQACLKWYAQLGARQLIPAEHSTRSSAPAAKRTVNIGPIYKRLTP